jgi:pantoate--beta-alanine ligase
MKLISDIDSFQMMMDQHRRSGKKISFIPTMGYLHQGHVSLFLKAKEKSDITIASIFVNPSQFGKNEDLSSYPRDISRDYFICERSGIDYIFYPSAGDMYKPGERTSVTVNELSDKLEGEYRPGHFSGVATIVLKLLNIINPDILFLGQKDAQQVVIIKKMMEDLNIKTKMEIVPTYREKNGLAMSSRNTYLTEKEKNEAGVIYKALQYAKDRIVSKEITVADEIKKQMTDIITSGAPDSKVQYVSITDNKNLDMIEDLSKYKGEILISLAVYFGRTRLIDNIIIRN